jgi:hypothetical protein
MLEAIIPYQRAGLGHEVREYMLSHLGARATAASRSFTWVRDTVHDMTALRSISTPRARCQHRGHQGHLDAHMRSDL